MKWEGMERLEEEGVGRRDGSDLNGGRWGAEGEKLGGIITLLISWEGARKQVRWEGYRWRLKGLWLEPDGRGLGEI